MNALPAGRFRPIGLDEIPSEAELLQRVDRKYILLRADARRMIAGMDDNTRVLQVEGLSGLCYESVYFDTPELLSYRMAALARRRRIKVRTRSYLDSGVAYLEAKARGSRSRTLKDRIDYAIEDRDHLTGEGRDYAQEALLAAGLPADKAGELDPTLATRYTRTTLLPPGTGSRVTVDTDLAWENADGDTLELPHLAIVETKSPGGASDTDRLLWRAGVRPVTISKYGTGLAAIRGDLPDNKWSRVLNRYFGESRAS